MRPVRIFKKIGIGFGVLFAILLIVAIAVPFFVNVDDYRPQIVQTVNDKINGKFELGKLKLTLWGQIKVEVDGFSLADSQGRQVVAAKDVHFHIPWLSILTASPLLSLRMNRPEVAVLKDKNGKMNVMTLMKPSTEATPTSSEPGKPDAPQIPGIAARARLGVEMRDAQMSYTDSITGLVTKVNDLNVIAKNLSLSQAMDVEVWANLDTKMGTMVVKGPARFTLKADPKFASGTVQEATVALNGDLNEVEISMPGLFVKSSSIPANAEAALKVSTKEARIENAKVRFHNAEITASGGLSNLDVAPVVNVSFKSNEIALKPWNQLVPMLKEYDLAGTASLGGGASGPTEKLDYNADLAVKGLTAKAPNLKAEPRIDLAVKVVTDKIQSLLMTMKAPGNDLKVSGTVSSFTAPRAVFRVTSTGMDLDQLVAFPKPAKGDGSKGGGKAASSESKPGKVEDTDASLDSLRANKMIAGTQAQINFTLPLLKAYGIKMTGIDGQMSFRDLAFAIERFKMAIWNGQVAASMNIAMKPKTPTYRFNANVAGLDIKQAVQSQLELFKDTLLGTASFSMEGSGASFDPDRAKGNLNAKGNMKVLNATFATIDIGRMASESINRAVNDLGAKVPQLKNVKINPPGSTEGKYESITSDFSINNGKFAAPNFFAKSEANKGIDVRGNTEVGLKDYSLNANWELVDTYNILKGRDVKVEHSGVVVERILADGDKPVTLPVKVAGTVFAPQPNYTAVPEALSKVALANVTRAIETKAKAEVKKKAEEEGKKLIQGFGKKLFGQ